MVIEQTIEIYQLNRHRLNDTKLRINAKTEIHRGTCHPADKLSEARAASQDFFLIQTGFAVA